MNVNALELTSAISFCYADMQRNDLSCLFVGSAKTAWPYRMVLLRTWEGKSFSLTTIRLFEICCLLLNMGSCFAWF